MKKLLFLPLIILMCCKEPQHITLSYIHNTILKDSAGSETQASILPLWGYTYQGSKYTDLLELCAVKHDGEKILVIGSDRVELNKNRDTKVLTRRFETLSIEESNMLLSKYKELVEKDNGAQMNEQIHFDYTIKKDVVISIVQKGKYGNPKYHIWIQGRDHFIYDYQQFLKAVNKFIAY